MAQANSHTIVGSTGLRYGTGKQSYNSRQYRTAVWHRQTTVGSAGQANNSHTTVGSAGLRHGTNNSHTTVCSEGLRHGTGKQSYNSQQYRTAAWHRQTTVIQQSAVQDCGMAQANNSHTPVGSTGLRHGTGKQQLYNSRQYETAAWHRQTTVIQQSAVQDCGMAQANSHTTAGSEGLRHGTGKQSYNSRQLGTAAWHRQTTVIQQSMRRLVE